MKWTFRFIVALFVRSCALPILLRQRPQETASPSLRAPNPAIDSKVAEKTHHLVNASKQKQPCSTANTIFDLGFYDGGDSRAYLSSGYCVVGIEADPDLVTSANQQFAAYVASGQLRMLNAVVAPEGDATKWSTFYKSKCTKEWNSFYASIGCRQCAPPHSLDFTMCQAVNVTATDCSGIFATYGTPVYLKLDIEGAETGCFQAMSRSPGNLAQYVSAEITELSYIDALQKLGYKGFKLVRQDKHNTVQANSGPWGDHALDCKTGAVWRTYQDIHAEFTAVLSKPHNPAEACPGGVMPIHGPPKPASSYIWYDIHAMLTEPPAAR